MIESLFCIYSCRAATGHESHGDGLAMPTATKSRIQNLCFRLPLLDIQKPERNLLICEQKLKPHAPHSELRNPIPISLFGHRLNLEKSGRGWLAGLAVRLRGAPAPPRKVIGGILTLC